MATEEDNFDGEIEALEDSEREQSGSLEAGNDETEHIGPEEQGGDGAGAERSEVPEGSDGQIEAQGVRTEGRFARQNRELRELREREGATTRELNELKAQMQRLTQPQQETAQQRADRLAGMTTEERLQFLLDESDQRNRQQMQVLQFQQNENTDKAEYNARMERDPRAKKYANEVEGLLQEFRRMGFFPKREACYYYLLGMKVANAKAPSRGQQAGVSQRRAAQTSRPGNVSGDVGRSRGGKTLEERLDGVLI